MKCPTCTERPLSYGSKRCRSCMCRDTACRRAIRRRRLLIAQIAAATGLHTCTVLRAARGAPVSARSARRLATILGIDVAVLLLGEVVT